jgi:hypothetical protein
MSSQEHPRIALKFVATPGHAALCERAAGPERKLAHTVDYTCGTCDAVLMHAEQVHNLLIRCTECGAFNATDQ